MSQSSVAPCMNWTSLHASCMVQACFFLFISGIAPVSSEQGMGSCRILDVTPKTNTTDAPTDARGVPVSYTHLTLPTILLV